MVLSSSTISNIKAAAQQNQTGGLPLNPSSVTINRLPREPIHPPEPKFKKKKLFLKERKYIS